MSADSDHVDLLRRGPRAWNAWRRQHPSIVPNLTRIFLSVGERQMGPMNGGPINLSSARLRRASLRFATLSGANLESADLSGADLTDARLDGANLANADLSQAVLDHADFARARLAGANLCGANLSKARNLTEAQLAEGGGDASTLLPPHLSAPESWTSPTVEYLPQPVVVEETRAVTPIAPGPRKGTASRVSWLVGGPLQTA
ncbi:pentapeptide repeat-containing protein [Methyloceanibacter sp.]|uniref:pentapeptide repeat-containing protein n=1 Tax=Methyloceanibacter sp. TaxID=1965321 RepID=UPI003C7443A7